MGDVCVCAHAWQAHIPACFSCAFTRFDQRREPSQGSP